MQINYCYCCYYLHVFYRAYTTPAVRDILCTFLVLFSVSRPFSAYLVFMNGKGTLCSEIIRRNFK